MSAACRERGHGHGSPISANEGSSMATTTTSGAGYRLADSLLNEAIIQRPFNPLSWVAQRQRDAERAPESRHDHVGSRKQNAAFGDEKRTERA